MTEVRLAGIYESAKSHSFRHGFATLLLESGYDAFSIQELLDYSDVAATEITTHVIS
jgi:site-specific recombinase XerD